MDNPELGRLVLKQVKAFPESFDMDYYVSECGTTACVAGHAMLLSGYELREGLFWRPDGSLVDDYDEEGIALLGLSLQEYGCRYPGGDARLFYMSNDEAIARLEELLR